MRISDWSSDVCSSDLRRLPCSTVRRSFSKCIISVPHCGQLEGIMVSSEDDRSCNSVITAPALSALTVMASVETLKKMLDPLVDAHERGSSGRGAGPERRATLPFAPPLYHSDSRALLHQLQSLRRPQLNCAPEPRTARKSKRLNYSHECASRMPPSA